MDEQKSSTRSRGRLLGQLFCLCCSILLLVAVQTVFLAEKKDITFSRFLNRVVFGDLWGFDEFCANQRNDSVVIEDDTQAQKLFNLSSLSSIKFTEDHATLNHLNQLSLISARSRKSLAVVCSTNAWGYADDHKFNESNLPHMNSNKCELQVDDLLTTLGYLKDPNLCYNVSALRWRKESILRSVNSGLPATISSDAYGQPIQLDRHLLNWLKIQANARVPVGPVFQAPVWLGDYNLCARFTDMRYCIGSYQMSNWPREPENTGLASIRVGLCLPRNCNDKNLQKDELLAKVDSILKYNLADLVGFTESSQYRIREVHCPPADDSPYRNILKDNFSKVIAVTCCLWLLTLVYVNMFVGCGRPKNKFLTCFDLSPIWLKFTRTDHLDKDLIGLNFIKLVATLWLMITHVYVLTGASYTFNMQDLRTSWRKSMLGAYVNQGQHVVSVFFLISGLLVGRRHLGKPLDTFKFIGCRYVRLLPMYLVVYTFIKQFGHLIGSGPLWDHGVSAESEARQCQSESWLVPLLMLANFIPPIAHCVLTGWHVANDFQIYLTLPFLLNIYKRSRTLGRLAALSSFFACHLYHAYNFHVSKKFTYDHLSGEPAIFGVSIILDRMSYDYVNPLGRIGTYFLGVLLADLLFYNNVNQNGTKIVAGQLAMSDNKNNLELYNRSSDGSWLGGLRSKSDDTSSNKLAVQNEPSRVTWKIMTAGQTKNEHANVADRWSLFPHLRYLFLGVLVERRNQILLLLGLFLINLTLSTVIWTKESKDVFGSYGKSLSYPLCRLSAELGFALVLYSLLASKVSDEKPVSSKENKVLSRSESDLFSPNVLMRLIRWPLWNLVVKLNYCVILVHFSIARYLVQSQPQLLLYSWANFFQLSSFVIVLTYMASFVLHLVVEVPLTSLVRIFTSALMNDRM